jgi:hypothetical protein
MPVSAAARTLFSFNAHCGTVFSLSDKHDLHLMGKCPIYPEVKDTMASIHN